jgi:hypothetical protein
LKFRSNRERTTSAGRLANSRVFRWIAGIISLITTTVITIWVTNASELIWDKAAERPLQPLATSINWESARARVQWGEGGTIWGVPGSHNWNIEQLRGVKSFKAWAIKNGGTPDGDSLVRINIQSTTSQAVIITDLRIEVVERRPAPSATLFDLCPTCSSITPGNFIADLDDPTVDVKPRYNRSTSKDTADFPHSVTAKDVEVIDLLSYTETCDCLWNLYLDWTSQGKSGTVLVNEKNKPFRTVKYVPERSKMVPVYR